VEEGPRGPRKPPGAADRPAGPGRPDGRDGPAEPHWRCPRRSPRPAATAVQRDNRGAAATGNHHTPRHPGRQGGGRPGAGLAAWAGPGGLGWPGRPRFSGAAFGGPGRAWAGAIWRSSRSASGGVEAGGRVLGGGRPLDHRPQRSRAGELGSGLVGHHGRSGLGDHAVPFETGRPPLRTGRVQRCAQRPQISGGARRLPPGGARSGGEVGRESRASTPDAGSAPGCRAALAIPKSASTTRPGGRAGCWPASRPGCTDAGSVHGPARQPAYLQPDLGPPRPGHGPVFGHGPSPQRAERDEFHDDAGPSVPPRGCRTTPTTFRVTEAARPAWASAPPRGRRAVLPPRAGVQAGPARRSP